MAASIATAAKAEATAERLRRGRDQTAPRLARIVAAVQRAAAIAALLSSRSLDDPRVDRSCLALAGPGALIRDLVVEPLRRHLTARLAVLGARVTRRAVRATAYGSRKSNNASQYSTLCGGGSMRGMSMAPGMETTRAGPLPVRDP